jgi:hypothetical protein
LLTVNHSLLRNVSGQGLICTDSPLQINSPSISSSMRPSLWAQLYQALFYLPSKSFERLVSKFGFCGGVYRSRRMGQIQLRITRKLRNKQNDPFPESHSPFYLLHQLKQKNLAFKNKNLPILSFPQRS